MTKNSSLTELQPIKKAFIKTINGMKIGPAFKGHTVMYHWPEIVGGNLANNVYPVGFENGKLYLTTSSSSWSNEIIMRRLGIIDKINKYIGSYAVKDIVIQANYRNIDKDKAAELYKQNQSPLNSNPIKKRMQRINLSDNELEDINKKCQSINDPELRTKVKRMLIESCKVKYLHLQDGWHQCANCGAIVDKRYSLCTACEQKLRLEHRKKIKSFLREMPWSTYAETCNALKEKISDSEFVDCRLELIRETAGRLKYSDQDTLDAALLTMLYKGCPMYMLNSDIIRKTFDRLRSDLADADEYYENHKKSHNWRSGYKK